MTSSPKKYTHKDFLNSWLAAKEHSNSHEDLRSYYGKVYSAFSRAFNVDLDQEPDMQRQHSGEDDRGTLHYFFLRVLRTRNSFSSPFDGVQVAPQSIVDLYQTLGEEFTLIKHQSQSLHDKLLLELIEKIWGITNQQTVTREELDQHGYPSDPVPDPFDYW